ncbi:DUF397 domain-containing protein [Actinomadura adrarensis]|uniref:DUF397 domain-containing protein n=1 Tax=Actinomadura adrarensis TaxID=1819600 RepID=A0ABW3CST8_9ACTN
MPVHWCKSTHSSGVNDEHCVEFGRLEDAIGVRDSKNPEGGHLSLSSADFGALLSRIKQRPQR